MPWNKAPFVRLLIPFIIGILIALYFPLNIAGATFYKYSFLGILFLCSLCLFIRLSYRWFILYGVIINLLFVFAGFGLVTIKREHFSETHFSQKLNAEKVLASVIISEAPEEKENSYQLIVEVNSITVENSWQPTKGRMIIYLSKEVRASDLKYGDQLLINTRIQRIKAPSNPSQFDYKQYLAYQQITHQTYLTSSNWIKTGHQSSNILYESSYRIRNYLLSVLEQYGISGEEIAVGSALLLGYRESLNDTIVSAYSSSGVMHILAVSGLHVGIIYLVFNYLLSWFLKGKGGRLLKAALLLLLLWTYALVTGMSPSVMRAVTMFSFIVVGESIQRKGSIYNTIAVSAFLLLLINPYLLVNVGFQLSYAAVIGIVLLYSRIYGLFNFKNRLIDQAWSILVVSFIAQLATAPLAMYYFHQFPTYFLLANLAVIPLATLVIYVGILLLVLHKITFLATYLALGFAFLLKLLNGLTKHLEQLPLASVQNISLSAVEVVLLYLFVIVLILHFIRLKIQYLYSAQLCIIIFLCLEVVNKNKQLNQRKFIVYDISKTTAVDFINGNDNLLFTDSTINLTDKKIKFNVQNNWIDLGIKHPNLLCNDTVTASLMVKYPYAQFYDKQIVFYSKEHLANLKTVPLNVDYLIVSGNVNLDIEQVYTFYKPKVIVFDSSNSYYRVRKWGEECAKLGVVFYDVNQDGAFVVNL